MFVLIDLLNNAYKSGTIKEEYIDIDIKRYPENIHLLYDQLEKMYTEFLGITLNSDLPNSIIHAFLPKIINTRYAKLFLCVDLTCKNQL